MQSMHIIGASVLSCLSYPTCNVDGSTHLLYHLLIIYEKYTCVASWGKPLGYRSVGPPFVSFHKT